MARRSRCSPKRILTMLKHVRKEDLNLLAEVGFSGVMKLKITKMSEKFLEWAVDHYEVSSRSFVVEGNWRLKLTEEDVARVYGLPRGPNHVDVKKYQSSLLKELGRELKLEDGKHTKATVELLVLKTRLTKEADMMKRMKLLILYIMGGLLCPTAHPVSSLGYLPLLSESALPDFKSYNWCKHVIDHFHNGMAAAKNNNYISADMHLLLVSLCDRMGEETSSIVAPSCKNWNILAVRKRMEKFNLVGGVDSAVEVKRQRKNKKPRSDLPPDQHALFPGTTLDVKDMDIDKAYKLKSWYEMTRATCEQHIATLEDHIARSIDKDRREEEEEEDDDGNYETVEHEQGRSTRTVPTHSVVLVKCENNEQEDQGINEPNQTTDADLELSNTLLSINKPHHSNDENNVRKSNGKRKLISGK